MKKESSAADVMIRDNPAVLYFTIDVRMRKQTPATDVRICEESPAANIRIRNVSLTEDREEKRVPSCR
jgi:hypothetical protein